MHLQNTQSQLHESCHINHISLKFILSGGGGWSPQLTDRSPWLQLDLRARMEVTAIATQGRHGSHDWVSGYTLLYSDSGSVWKQYRNEDRVAVSLPEFHYIISSTSRKQQFVAMQDFCDFHGF